MADLDSHDKKTEGENNMNAFTQMGMDAFNEGIASGMAPEAAANAAGDAMGAAATDMGFPADMVADGVASGMETFTQALAL